MLKMIVKGRQYQLPRAKYDNEAEWLEKGSIDGRWYIGHCDWCSGETEYPDVSGIHFVNEFTALKWAYEINKNDNI